MEWKDRQNDIDDVMAEDINELAHEVIRLDSDKADSENENGGFSAGVNSRAGSGAGIGAWSVAYSGCAAGKYAKAEYGGAAGHGAVTSDGFAGGYDAKAADQNGRGIDAVQLGTGTNGTPKTLQIYDKQLLDANGNIPAERLANAPKTNVVDSLTSNSTTNALSANQGKILNEKIDEVSGKRTARFIVGTSTAGWTDNDCDYLCDGTDDQEEINAAIQALPDGGGEIKLLDGTYNITSDILVNKNSIILNGSGIATKITCPAPEGIQNISVSANNCIVRNLQTSMEGSFLITGNYNTIMNCKSLDASGFSVSGSYNIIEKCDIGDVSFRQHVFSGAGNHIINNRFNGVINSSAHNTFEVNSILGDMGICHTFQTDNIINGNYFYNGGFTCEDRNTVAGNYIENEGGICITGIYNTVSGNTFYYCMGAMVQNVIVISLEAKYNNINGNTVHGDAISVEGGQYCVSVAGSNNMITSNFLNSDVENTGSNNLVTNNLIVAPEG